MRRWMAAPLVFAAAAALTAGSATPQAAAQDKKYDPPTPEQITTADGVTLRGLFHKSPTAAKHRDQVVILMYPPGGGRDMTKGDWAGLANRLTDEGYHVMRFDWRGHGKSTEISDVKAFWQTSLTAPTNIKYITGGTKMPPKNDFNAVKDLTPQKMAGYFPVFVNDLAAIRVHLDKLNDTGDVNTSSVYLVGAGDAATIGMMWMVGESLRPAVYPTPNELGIQPRYTTVPQQLRVEITQANSAGATIAGAVWLTPSRPKAGPTSDYVMKGWVSKLAQPIRDVPMLFLYGEKDGVGASQAKFFYHEVLVAEGRGNLLQKLDKTFIREVKGTTLSGVALLGNDTELKTETRLVEYLGVIQKKRADTPRVNRGFTSPYLFSLSYFLGGNNP